MSPCLQRRPTGTDGAQRNAPGQADTGTQDPQPSDCNALAPSTGKTTTGRPNVADALHVNQEPLDAPEMNATTPEPAA